MPPPEIPKFIEIYEEPRKEDNKYNPKLTIFDKLFSSRKERKIQESVAKFEQDHQERVIHKSNTDKKNEKIKSEYDVLNNKWNKEMSDFFQKQKEYNESIDLKEKKHFDNNPESIFEYCDMVLTNSEYPDFFPKEFNIDFNPKNEILIVDYSLPSIEDIPTLTEVKYIQTKDEYKESFLSDAALNKLLKFRSNLS